MGGTRARDLAHEWMLLIRHCMSEDIVDDNSVAAEGHVARDSHHSWAWDGAYKLNVAWSLLCVLALFPWAFALRGKAIAARPAVHVPPEHAMSAGCLHATTPYYINQTSAKTSQAKRDPPHSYTEPATSACTHYRALISAHEKLPLALLRNLQLQVPASQPASKQGYTAA